MWRVNFSRVQWQHDIVDGRYVKRPDARQDNWIWTPPHTINMQRPRQWALLEFREEDR